MTSPSSATTSMIAAWIRQEVQVALVTCYTNERPPSGLCGAFDWKLHGLISKFLRSDAINTQPGAMTYLPHLDPDRSLHLFILGGGHSDAPGIRKPIPTTALKQVKENLLHLKLDHVALQAKDLGLPVPEIERALSPRLKVCHF